MRVGIFFGQGYGAVVGDIVSVGLRLEEEEDVRLLALGSGARACLGYAVQQAERGGSDGREAARSSGERRLGGGKCGGGRVVGGRG